MMGFWDAVASAGPYAIKSAPRSRQITTPTSHHSIFTGWSNINKQTSSTTTTITYLTAPFQDDPEIKHSFTHIRPLWLPYSICN